MKVPVGEFQAVQRLPVPHAIQVEVERGHWLVVAVEDAIQAESFGHVRIHLLRISTQIEIPDQVAARQIRGRQRLPRIRQVGRGGSLQRRARFLQTGIAGRRATPEAPAWLPGLPANERPGCATSTFGCAVRARRLPSTAGKPPPCDPFFPRPARIRRVPTRSVLPPPGNRPAATPVWAHSTAHKMTGARAVTCMRFYVMLGKNPWRHSALWRVSQGR